jgi:hypothetical protein
MCSGKLRLWHTKPYVIHRVCWAEAQQAQEPCSATRHVKLEQDHIPTSSILVAVLYGYETWFLIPGKQTHCDSLTERCEWVDISTWKAERGKRIETMIWRTSMICTRWQILTLYLLTWRIWWAPNNTSKWQMGFNSAFKGLIQQQIKKFMRWTGYVARCYKMIN